ncbi:MAG TPA: glycoside hydrolase family 15 protein [Streptosporangiaceae bacterium]|nr:glycoside hydrolase family 15 protein [Streptosporangiaceae bacterium]
MPRYPGISDHGLIGDLQTAALVSTDGCVDWFCTPRFDAPSVFAALLDAAQGGHFAIAPEGCEYVTRQMYLPDTAILITRFMSADGVGEVCDFMPVLTGRPTGRHRIVRQIRVTRGSMKFALDLQPRFDYARQPHTTEVSDDGAVFRSGTQELTLHTVGRRGGAGTQVRRQGRGVRAAWTLGEGEAAGVVLESMGGAPRRLPPGEADRLSRDTAAFWRGWLAKSTYAGRWREVVARSAITLKLLTYAPTGAPIAAATAGLPEQVGGERNWDYRYTWIRDASFSIYALLGLGFRDEAAAFGIWMRDRTTDQAGNGSGPMKIMYRVDGSSDLAEETLGHLEGWRGSAPVRIGNGAADQLQLDIYGEALDALALADTTGLQMAHQGWLAVTGMIDWVCEHWDQPEEGIWETRGGRQDYTYGRFQAWVALDRGIRLAERHGRPADLDRWRTERDLVYQQVMARGFNPRVGAFTQHYGTEVLDSSLLLMPLMDFVAPGDPMWLSTLDAINRELVSDSLVYRYNPSASPDGLRGQEGTFSLCTFWYVDALARSGRLEEAQLTFEKMHTYANHVGLYSEEIGMTGEQLGNFPQAFSHLSLINAAINLDYQLDHGAGRVDRVLTGR